VNVRQKVRYIILASVAVLAVGGFGAYWSVQRVNELRALQIETQSTIGNAYRLLFDSTQITGTAERLQPYFDRWQDSLAATGRGIRTVTEHPALNRIAVDQIALGRSIESVSVGWQYSAELFTQATTQIEQIFEGDLAGILTPTGIDNMAFQLRQMTTAATQEERDEELEFVRTLQRRMHNATVSLSYFVTENLQSLVDRIETETTAAVEQTIYVTFAAIALLVAAAIAGLLTGTRFLDRANRTLEERVRERTRSIQSLLDFSGQGFLSFGDDFLVRPEYSRECETIFGRGIGGADIAELLYHTDTARDDFRDALRLVFSGTSNPSVVFELIDDEVSVNDRTIRLDFRQIDDGTVMCSLQDVTEQKRLQEAVSRQAELRDRLLAVVEHRGDFAALMNEAREVFAQLDAAAGGSVPDETVRALHTFKANAGFLKLQDTASAAHELEQSIADSALLSDTLSVADGLELLRSAWEHDLSVVEEHLGSDWVTPDETVVVSREKLDALRDAISGAGVDDPDIRARVRDLQLVPLASMETRLAAMARTLAEQRGKRVGGVFCDLGALAVEPEIYSAVVDALTHIVRNMIDHGIERPRIREQSGKPPEGSIRVVATEIDGSVQIEVEDDGKGIDVEAVRARAVEHHLIDETREIGPPDLVRLIFRDGFSTAPSVSAVSGRGEGLPAVRDSLRRVSGRVSLATRRGKGTRFVLTVPKYQQERIAV